MRHTLPLSAEEQRVDAAIRARFGSHSDQDRALTFYRVGVRLKDRRALERTADLMLGEVSHDVAR